MDTILSGVLTEQSEQHCSCDIDFLKMNLKICGIAVSIRLDTDSNNNLRFSGCNLSLFRPMCVLDTNPPWQRVLTYKDPYFQYNVYLQPHIFISIAYSLMLGIYLVYTLQSFRSSN